ncbi:hypothetical protein [Thermopirellula anaerolimosa]
MTIGRREITLLAVLSLFGVLLVGTAVYSAVVSPYLAKQRNYQQLAAQVAQKQRQLNELTKAEEKLRFAREQSLPADPAAARRLYENWLLQSAQAAGFDGVKIESGEVRREKDLFYRFPVVIRGQATLEKLTSFLHAFYARKYLHRIQQISITPAKDGKSMDLMVSVDAVVLDDAAAKEALPEGEPTQRELPPVKDYVSVIAGRNLFAVYQPPPPPRPPRPPEPPRPSTPPPPPALDPSRFAYINAIVEVNGKREVWLYSRTEGKTLRLNENDPFAIGAVKGRVTRIGIRDVEVEVNGEPRVLSLGDCLYSDGKPAHDET